jgi:nucleotide-binding universal stress UspA family protein
VYESIVVGTDGSDSATRAVDEATRLAGAVGATLHVVSAFEPVRGARVGGTPEGGAGPATLPADTKVQGVIEEAAARVRMSGVSVKTHTLTGDPADALIEVAGREHAGLIVVGSYGMHGMGRVRGSVPNRVSHRARCSVLIVATEQDAA